MSAPVIEVRDAVKAFGPVVALNRVSIHLEQGEILALLGDNGAGKSTLVKCITGVHRLDGGEIVIGGNGAHADSTREARELGIETVYQDLSLFDNLSATANFYASREISRLGRRRSLGFLCTGAMLEETRAILERLGVNLFDPSAEVGLMSGGQRQAIAVARAVAFASRIVILDEPTAALGVRESRHLLDLVKRLPEQGVSVIFVSHNLEHVAAVATRAVVLRRGAIVGEAVPSPENHERIVSLIVGGGLSNGRRPGPEEGV